MLTRDEVKKISHKIALENGISDDTLSADISNIVYCTDVFECGDTPIIDQHIDIEYSFGECYEVHKDAPLFQFICTLCDLPLLQEEKEIVIYSKDEE